MGAGSPAGSRTPNHAVFPRETRGIDQGPEGPRSVRGLPEPTQRVLGPVGCFSH